MLRYSSKESWSPSDLQCHKKGLTKYRCFSKCHPKKKICTVDTVVERCSCNGMNVHFINSAVFSLKKSKKITQAGFSVFAQVRKGGDHPTSLWRLILPLSSASHATNVVADGQRRAKSRKRELKRVIGSKKQHGAKAKVTSLTSRMSGKSPRNPDPMNMTPRWIPKKSLRNLKQVRRQHDEI